MKQLLIALIIMATGLSGAQCAATAPRAPEVEAEGHSGLMVVEPWGRAATAGHNGAVYLTLTNQTGADERLLGATTDVAETVELHETTMDENEVMRMQPIPTISIPAGQSVSLEPGGKHLMLLTLQRDLALGQTFPVTLDFENSDSLTIEVEVREGMSLGQDMNIDSEN